LGTLLSQLPQVALHAVHPHEPLVQLAPLTLTGLHALPQVPQFVSVFTGVSQPLPEALLTTPSQLPKRLLHVLMAHLFDGLQTGVAFESAQSPHLGTVRTVPQLSVRTMEPHSAPAEAQSDASVAAGQPQTLARPVAPQLTPVPVQVPQVTVRVAPQLSTAV
jgi:hypothetical protein